MTFQSYPPAPTVPPGTPVHTRWGWVTAFVPVAGAVLTAVQFWAMSGALLDYVHALVSLIAAQRNNPGAYDPSALSGLFGTLVPLSIGSALLGLLGWGLYALGVVAAYLDHRELGRLGYPKRFPWAWSFLNPVYPIGRAVVVHRQAGAGRATMWIAIAAAAATLLISVIWTVWLMVAMFGAMGALRGTMA